MCLPVMRQRPRAQIAAAARARHCRWCGSCLGQIGTISIVSEQTLGTSLLQIALNAPHGASRKGARK